MKIPVFVLSGFLGSGKTTLLMQLLKETRNRGLRPGILMNELGRQDVDGNIVDEAAGLAVEKLLDGCVCCSKKEELAGCLKLLLGQKPAVLFIELTGVANPEEIADALTEPGLLGVVTLKQIVTVLDAEHVLEYNSIFSSDRQLVATLRKQIEAADLILINKTDLVPPAQLAKIEKSVRKQNEKSLIVHTVRSQIDVSPLLASIASHEPAPLSVRPFRMLKSVTAVKREAEDHVHKHEQNLSYSRVQTVTLPWHTAESVSRQRLEQFLARWNKQLLRAKGYVACGPQGTTMLMQFAGKRTYWEPSQFAGDPYVVFIGIDLNAALLEKEWSRLFEISS